MAVQKERIGSRKLCHGEDLRHKLTTIIGHDEDNLNKIQKMG